MIIFGLRVISRELSPLRLKASSEVEEVKSPVDWSHEAA